MFEYVKNICKLFKYAFVKDPMKNTFKALPGRTVPYIINDPTTPELIVERAIPLLTSGLKFNVVGYSNKKSKPGTLESQADSCYITVGNCSNYVQNMTRPPIRRWAAVDTLTVHPRAGRQFNAYYNRQGLYFFFDKDPVKKKLIYTADSSDIVAHELGHAILDALRKDFWSTQALEIWSLHETFADVMAIVSIMQYEETLEYAISQTKGNLRKSNVISRLAEEMGGAIYKLTGRRRDYDEHSLRDAVNKFKYIDPRHLPKDGPNDKIIAECHSFGRIFLGAWYDIMVGIYEIESKNKKRVEALKYARDVAFDYFVRACCIAPRVIKINEAVAKMMVEIDNKNGSPYAKLLRKTFKNRNLLMPQIKMLSSMKKRDVINKLKSEDKVIKHDSDTLICIAENTSIKLSELGVSAMSANGYDLSNVELDVPNDTYYRFEKDVLVDEIKQTKMEIIESASSCAKYIRDNDMVGTDSDTMWQVTDGKLLRTFVK